MEFRNAAMRKMEAKSDLNLLFNYVWLISDPFQVKEDIDSATSQSDF